MNREVEDHSLGERENTAKPTSLDSGEVPKSMPLDSSRKVQGPAPCPRLEKHGKEGRAHPFWMERGMLDGWREEANDESSMGRWVLSHWTGRYMIEVDPHRRTSEEERQKTGQALSLLLFDYRHHDSKMTSFVNELCRVLPLSSVCSGSRSDGHRAEHRLEMEKICRHLEEAAVMGRLVVLAEALPVARTRAVDLAEPAAPISSNEEETLHWIEVQVLDLAGRPIPGRAYELTLPDGSKRSGSLDDSGMLSVEDIPQAGRCQLELTDTGDQEWQSGFYAGSA